MNGKHATDEALLRSARDGRIASFDVITNRYRQVLIRYVEMLGAGELDSEGIVQDTFLKAFRHVKQFSGKSKFSTWLFAIARNETYREMKKHRTVPLEDYHAEGSATPELEALRKEKLEEAKAALKKLPRLQRESIVLTRYCGMKCHEVADLLETTGGSVRTAIYKGIRTLELSVEKDD